jgi:DNA repair protein RecN (Recombination protein N)
VGGERRRGGRRILVTVLRAIELKDFAIADAVEVPLRPGLNVLTGETGAGKSLVVDALALVSGGRADAGVVRAGATSALVQLHFEDGGPIATAARRIVPEGRNLARLDGEVVTVAELQGALDAVVGIFGQHAYRTLLDAQQQRLTLDALLGDAGRAALAAYREAHAALTRTDAALAELRAATQDRERRLEVLRHDRDELDAAGIRPGESAELDERLALLRGADRVRESAARALAALDGGQGAIDGLAMPRGAHEGGAIDALAEAQRSLAAAARQAPPLTALAEELRVALDGAQAVSSEIEAFLHDLDADPAALDRAETRRSELDRLFRKHGGDEEAVLALRARIEDELAALERQSADVAALEAERAAFGLRRRSAGDALSAARAATAATLGPAVSEALRELALPHAAFAVSLEPLEHPGSHGFERIEFRFSANPGEGDGPLSAIASGGELSRVMLALHAVAGSERPVLAFDEVDAGVGGRTGRAVGRLLHRLAAGRQVLVVTHLAQIAAFADHHLVVDKATDEGRTRTRVTPVEGEARVRELARMLAGDDGPTARAHAEELLAAPS